MQERKPDPAAEPATPEYVVIRMKPERIRLMDQAGKGYEDIVVPK